MVAGHGGVSSSRVKVLSASFGVEFIISRYDSFSNVYTIKCISNKKYKEVALNRYESRLPLSQELLIP